MRSSGIRVLQTRFGSIHDDDARKLVAGLSNDLGFDTVQADSLAASRFLEPFALTWISGAYRFGLGRDYAFTISRR